MQTKTEPIEDLSLATIDTAFLAHMPELEEPYKKAQKEAGYEHEPLGAYATFWHVLKPVLWPLLDSDHDNPMLKRILEFIERLAKSSDLEVVNLVWLEFAEPLVVDQPRLAVAWKNMGPATKRLSRKVARKCGFRQNIPSRFSLW